MRTHLVIPDTQVHPGVPLDHLRWIGRYILEKKPDVVVHLGDHYDLPSLSSYDKKGSKKFVGRSLRQDLDWGHKGLRMLTRSTREYNQRHPKHQYNPEMYVTLGNHEERLNRAIDDDPYMLQDIIGPGSEYDFQFEKYGFKPIPFKEILFLDGIAYSHYFYNPMSGRPYAGKCHTRLNNIGFSFTMGHQQTKDIAEKQLANGQVLRGLIVGACYIHEEDFLGPQTHYWRGIIVKYECNQGDYCLLEVSLDYLCRRYEGITLKEFLNENT